MRISLRTTARKTLRLLTLLPGLGALGCQVFDDKLEKRIAPVAARECESHEDCAERNGEPFACVPASGKCVQLRSPECKEITGTPTPNAIILGSLFSVSGPQKDTNLPRQQSAMLAVKQLNAAGGIPGPDMTPRKLVLVSCDEAGNLDGSVNHLIHELKVPAIVGPNVSQDVIEISTGQSVPAGTVLISPTAVASSIRHLNDNNLTWTMVPSDEQRAPLMKHQISALEKQLRGTSGRAMKLAIVHRNDALGTGSAGALNDLVFNGPTVAQAVAEGLNTVVVDAYDPQATEQRAIVDKLLAFKPDIIVMAGLAEVITRVMVPLETDWQGDARPYYVLIDSLKIPEVLTAATGNDSLRRRLRGTGIVPTALSAPVYEAFRVAYQAEYPGSPAAGSGLGPAYDATYGIAYALTLTRDRPATGATVAEGLRLLSQGGDRVEVKGTKILEALQHLSTGEPIEAIGTFASLQWDDRGAPTGSQLEMWCVASGDPKPVFGGSGLFMDLKTQAVSGEYKQCD